MITAATNPKLKLVRKLLAQKRKRDELGSVRGRGRGSRGRCGGRRNRAGRAARGGRDRRARTARGRLDAAASGPRRSPSTGRPISRASRVRRRWRSGTSPIRATSARCCGPRTRSEPRWRSRRAAPIRSGRRRCARRRARSSACRSFRSTTRRGHADRARRPRRHAAPRARPRGRDDVRPRGGARGAAGGASCFKQPCRDDRAAGRCRVAQRRGRRRDRALRALAPRDSDAIVRRSPSVAPSRENQRESAARPLTLDGALRGLVAAAGSSWPVRDRVAGVARASSRPRRPACGRSAGPCRACRARRRSAGRRPGCRRGRRPATAPSPRGRGRRSRRRATARRSRHPRSRRGRSAAGRSCSARTPRRARS